MNKLSRLGWLLLVCLWVGCSSHEESPTDAGASGAGGTSGSSGGGTGGTGGGGGTGGLFDLDGGLTLSCDTKVTSVTSCGTETCTALPKEALDACQVNCCTAQNKCGQRNTDPMIGSLLGATCQEPATKHASCPDVMFMGMQLTGCCTAQGTCGYAIGGSSCFAPTFGGQTPKKCDDEDAGTL